MLSIELKDFKKITKNLEATNKKSEKALKRIVGDFKSRAPGWVASSVTSVYSINKKDIMPRKKNDCTKKKALVRVRGKTIDEAQIVYSGRALTPTHFKMKPTSRPLAKIKKVKKKKEEDNDDGKKKKKEKKPPKYAPYEVTVEIYKGKRESLGNNIFLGGNKGDGQIPFQRVGKARLPIEAVKTVSVPQMIENEEVRDKIRMKINDGLEKRMLHHKKLLE